MSSVEIPTNKLSTQLRKTAALNGEEIPFSTKVHEAAADIFLFLLGLPDSFGPERRRFSQNMRICPGIYNGQSRLLSDGTLVRAGDKVGILDLDKRIYRLEHKDSFILYTKELSAQALRSMQILARMCILDSEEVKDMVAFYGISHLAGPSAQKLGFDSFEIVNPSKKIHAYLQSKTYTWIIAHRNKTWQRMNRNFRTPREMLISRRRVVELHRHWSDELNAKQKLVTPQSQQARPPSTQV